MNLDDLSKEQKIMVVMRKTLTNIVRELTPEPGVLHPLSAGTLEDLRQCLMLISARERELLQEQGITNTARPRFTDQPKTSQVVQFTPRTRPGEEG